MTFMVMFLNPRLVWVSDGLVYASKSEAWNGARKIEETKAIRIVEIVGEIERIGDTQ